MSGVFNSFINVTKDIGKILQNTLHNLPTPLPPLYKHFSLFFLFLLRLDKELLDPFFLLLKSSSFCYPCYVGRGGGN